MLMRTLDFMKMVEFGSEWYFVNAEVENIRLPSILQPLPSKQDLLEEI